MEKQAESKNLTTTGKNNSIKNATKSFAPISQIPNTARSHITFIYGVIFSFVTAPELQILSYSHHQKMKYIPTASQISIFFANFSFQQLGSKSIFYTLLCFYVKTIFRLNLMLDINIKGIFFNTKKNKLL